MISNSKSVGKSIIGCVDNATVATPVISSSALHHFLTGAHEHPRAAQFNYGPLLSFFSPIKSHWNTPKPQTIVQWHRGELIPFYCTALLFKQTKQTSTLFIIANVAVWTSDLLPILYIKYRLHITGGCDETEVHIPKLLYTMFTQLYTKHNKPMSGSCCVWFQLKLVFYCLVNPCYFSSYQTLYHQTPDFVPVSINTHSEPQWTNRTCSCSGEEMNKWNTSLRAAACELMHG